MQYRSWLLLLLVYVCFSLLPGRQLQAQTRVATPRPSATAPVVLATGDIANCSNHADERTAQLLAKQPGTVLALGDSAYEAGSIRDYLLCYAASWGPFKARIRPVPGDLDYSTGSAMGYFGYFGKAATPLEPTCTAGCKGYYSFDLGAWHLIALNSEIDTNPGSAQEQWLRADLAAHPNECTLAYWHRPRYSSGNNDGASVGLWQALYEHGADVVLVAHDRLYERFAPQDPTGGHAPNRGIREFVVGTGGAPLSEIKFVLPNSEVRNNKSWGLLKLTLHPTSYEWEFLPLAGQTFRDAGRADCVSSAQLATATSTPPNPTRRATIAPTQRPILVATATPDSTPTAAPLIHTVASGETLSSIAAQYNLDWRALLRLNELDADAVLQIGQEIRIR